MICETKWRRQVEGQALILTEAVETTLGVKRFLTLATAEKVTGGSLEEEFGLKKIYTSRGYKPNLRPAVVLQVTAKSRYIFCRWNIVDGKLTLAWSYFLLLYYYLSLCKSFITCRFLSLRHQ